jgi:hypothetical protein
MSAEWRSKSPSLITGIFCEPFCAASAIAALLRSGFADADISAVGVLEGHAPAVREFFLGVGLSSHLAAFYSDWFDDGAVLLMVHANAACRKIAIELLKHYGGVCAPVANDTQGE